MNILLVYPAFPKTYWGAEYTMKFVGKKSILPPLGLLTVAAMLPAHWQVKLCDMNVRELQAGELAWSDVVFISGMLVQNQGMHEVARLAKAAGKPVVAGGPYASTLVVDLPSQAGRRKKLFAMCAAEAARYSDYDCTNEPDVTQLTFNWE